MRYSELMNSEFVVLASTLLVLSFACASENGGASPAQDVDARRNEMVEAQLRGRDIRSARVLDAMRKVPRHLFVPASQRGDAYADHPLRSATDRRFPSHTSWRS